MADARRVAPPPARSLRFTHAPPPVDRSGVGLVPRPGPARPLLVDAAVLVAFLAPLGVRQHRLAVRSQRTSSAAASTACPSTMSRRIAVIPLAAFAARRLGIPPRTARDLGGTRRWPVVVGNRFVVLLGLLTPRRRATTCVRGIPLPPLPRLRRHRALLVAPTPAPPQSARLLLLERNGVRRICRSFLTLTSSSSRNLRAPHQPVIRPDARRSVLACCHATVTFRRVRTTSPVTLWSSWWSALGRAARSGAGSSRYTDPKGRLGPAVQEVAQACHRRSRFHEV
ncbi:uncharacterized protein LOC120672304 [Panicum virgatum]|uniref:Uncharacterized protein n=1 Tax=Panicum virgatum TaxID=38727 RepID=A0A8T0RYN6_PANVG|nr:uncharacterized protein LOC120672304 [Panicum virgatum]KAG2591742.1 hypothetical protein PVAP13_5NG502900 [Panicum virgatum]